MEAYMGQMGSGIDNTARVIFDHELDGLGLDFDLMIPGDMIEDIRYLVSEESPHDINWRAVQEILQHVPGLSAYEARALRHGHVVGLEIDGGW